MSYAVFLLALTCHEAAHALAAKWGGDPTAYYSGQVTLNPWPHIRREPFGTVVVPALTFYFSGSVLGWGSAPYDPFWEQRHPKRAAWMALAGPLANFGLVILAAITIHLGILAGVFQIPSSAGYAHVVNATGAGLSEGLAAFVSRMFSLNLLLGVFNLLPVAPLDGHSAIGLILPDAVHRRFLEFIRQPMPSLLGLMIAWRAVDPLFYPIFGIAINLLYWGAGFQ